MAKFNIPDRKYTQGLRKMISIRLPERLMEELDRIAREKGWTTTDVIQTVLDQYVQWEKKN